MIWLDNMCPKFLKLTLNYNEGISKPLGTYKLQALLDEILRPFLKNFFKRFMSQKIPKTQSQREKYTRGLNQ